MNMKTWRSILGRLAIPLLFSLISLLTIAATGWVGDGLKGECLFEPWLGKCNESGLEEWVILGRASLAALGFMVFAFFTYRLAKDWIPVRHLKQAEQVRPHAILIAPISKFNPLPKLHDGKCRVILDVVGVELTGDIRADILSLEEIKNKDGKRSWNGQQFLRGIEPHIKDGKLSDLVLIGSKGDKGSHATLHDVKDMVLLYSKNLNVHFHEEGIDFENIKELQKAFDYWIDKFLREGCAEREILIDVTGGQKPTSIAAALTTLRWKEVEFQYVGTSDVISFNVVVEAPQQRT